ncbi:unnamed protein product [Sphagnum troendelagicum]|uniref:Uncharacterized protein n=1 Tax=Sphagnum troendelagicum TaxID=128251 RepID=A0ABP0UMW0_9BRYO
MRLVTSKLRVSMAAGTMLRQGALSHLSSFFPHRTQFPSRWSEFRSSNPPASVTCNKWVVCQPVLHFKLSRPASSGELHTIDTRIHNMVKAHSTRAVEVTKKFLEIQLTIKPTQNSDSFLESSSILDNGLEDIVDMEDDESVLESVDLVMSAPEEVTIPTSNACIVGVDPVVSGALAVIKSEDQGAAAEVLEWFYNPVQVNPPFSNFWMMLKKRMMWSR